MADLSKQDEEKIRKWGETVTGEISLGWATATDESDDRFREFVQRMGELAPTVRMKKDGDATVSRPTLFVGGRVQYQAIPLDRELEPFLAVLGDPNVFSDRIAPEDRSRLQSLFLPALFTVYITPHCPFCPVTVSTLLGLSAISEMVRVTIVDGEMFREHAQKDGVQSAPTVILDDRFRWTGAVDVGELVTVMLDRDPVHLGAEALKGVIEGGNAEAVSRMMIDRQMIFPAFIELLTHSRWSVRLGAMVAYETMVEEDPNLAGQIVEPLMAAFAKGEDPVKGDLLHVLGESGNKAILPFLSEVIAGDFDDEVKEAATEAMEKLT